MKTALAAGALLALSVLAACPSSPESATAAAPLPAPKTADHRDTRIRVRTLTLAPAPFEEFLDVSGTLEPVKDALVASEMGGLVREVLFEKGQAVREGQVLARVGDDLAEARLDQARADLMAAEANYQKTSRLFERQAVPQQDLVAATSRRDRAQAVVREMEIRLERAVIRSPLDGIAADRRVDPGEVIAPSTPIALVQRLDPLKVACRVPDTEIGWLRRGTPARVTMDAWPDQVLEARVGYVAESAGAEPRSFLVEVELPNPGRRMIPGLVARVQLLRRRLEQALVIPIDALVTTDTGHVAYVVEQCRARRIPVAMRAVAGDRVLVDGGGLDFGMRLVVDGQRDLGPGREVIAEGCE
ncbi:MAG: efflux RND transporter periplasmic adaptor subunit [Acidobacteriota bacterium]|nr:efflux RND transporter periplasmic adaptor subunit [Acidobacteriota bacterium]